MSQKIRNLLEHLVGVSEAAQGAAVTWPTAGESTGILGLRKISESGSPLFQSINSSMGVGMPALAGAVCARLLLLLLHPVLAPLLLLCLLPLLHILVSQPCTLIRGRTRVGFRVPREGEVFQRWGFRTGRRFASCLRGGDGGKFSAGRR